AGRTGGCGDRTTEGAVRHRGRSGPGAGFFERAAGIETDRGAARYVQRTRSAGRGKTAFRGELPGTAGIGDAEYGGVLPIHQTALAAAAELWHPGASTFRMPGL